MLSDEIEKQSIQWRSIKIKIVRKGQFLEDQNPTLVMKLKIVNHVD